VEDNMHVQSLNKRLLEAKGFTVKLAMTLNEARKVIDAEMPGLIILDIHLPDGNGLDFLRELRKKSMVPVIALTCDNAEKDLITGFASGLDDYVPKPYTFPVLSARIEALLRRAERVPETVVKDHLCLDMTSGAALLSGTDLLLTQKEFALLLIFVQNEGKLLRTEHLYKKIWKAQMGEDKNTIQVTISKLRKKIALSGYDIIAMRGLGYVFEKN